MSEQRIPYRIAEPMARQVLSALAPTAMNIEIAGCIRRESPVCIAVEIVAIPTSATYRVMEGMVTSGAWHKALYGSDRTPRWGMSYRGIEVSDFNPKTDQRIVLRVECFFTDRDSWGYQLALRTGPGEANQRLMRYTHQTPIRCIDGAVWYAEDWRGVPKADGLTEWLSETKRRVKLPVEAAWFALWGMQPVPPPLRRESMYDAAHFTPSAMTLGDAPIRQQSLF